MRTPNTSLISRAGAIVTVAVLVFGLGCATQPPIVQRDDSAITSDVQARFAADAEASPLDINVSTKDGVVSLSGSVATDTERQSVERIASEAPGVRAVDNNVRFGGKPSIAEPVVP